MDALSAIRSRRSIRKYAEQAVPKETIAKILEAAYDAPSGANRQPRSYVVVTDREALDGPAEVHPHCSCLKAAPAAIAIVGDPARGRYWLEASCAAAQNM